MISCAMFWNSSALKKATKILYSNAFRIDWKEVEPKTELSNVTGNDAFISHQWRTKENIKDIDLVLGKGSKSSRLDYIAAWL